MANTEQELLIAEIGRAVKRLRKKRGLTQAELGEKIGKPLLTISRLETASIGDTHIGLLREISEGLGVDLCALLSSATVQNENHLDLETRWQNLKRELAQLTDDDQEKITKVIESVVSLYVS